ncbi:CBS domain-containing protein CBSCBSPB1-like protein [Tanacetum coccineum]
MLLTKAIHAVLYVLMWSIWKWRNRVTHASEETKNRVLIEDIFLHVQQVSLLWLSNRCKNLQLDWNRWVLAPRERLCLKKAFTLPESTTINEACRWMDVRKVDVLLLTDSKGLLCGILSDRDITTRVVACELDIENTPVSAVMTKNPVFVTLDTHDVEALQKVVPGKFRYLPVVKDEDAGVSALGDVMATQNNDDSLCDEYLSVFRKSQEVLVDIPERITEHGLSSEITQSSGGSSDTSEGSENSGSFEDYGSSGEGLML